MNIKRTTKRTSYQTGTQHALCESNEPCDGTISIFGTLSNPGKRVIPTTSYHCKPQQLEEPNYSVYSSCASSRFLCFDVILLLYLQFRLSHQFVDEFYVFVVNQEFCLSLNWALRKYQVLRRKRDCSVKVRIKGQFTVKSLHAGTLVTYWTTAPSIPLLRSPRAQLASLLLVLCTLAIATRCYASTNSTHPQIDQAQSTPTFSPIHNSKLHSSNLVLSRLILPHFVQKSYASLARIFPSSRTKRELDKTNSNLIPEDPLLRTKGSVTRFEEVNVQNLAGGKNYHNPGLSNGVGRDIAPENKIGENLSDVVSVAGNFSRVISQKLNYSFPEVERPDKQLFQEQDRRLMPPVDGNDKNSSVDKWGVVVSIIISSVALTLTFGLITCILSHYRGGAAAEGGGTATDPNNAALTPTSAPMLSVVSAGATAGVGGMERLRGGRTAARDLAAAREQQVRLHALRTDLAVNLPPSITMPDGEDHPYSNARIHIRDAEQEAEIYQKCIRPPPNRTVLESESPPPYRSSSAGLLGSSSSSSSSGDWSTLGGMSNAPLVERCHSMSSTTRRPEAGGSNQKTDLLQRTVKIFTGKRATPQAPSPAPTLPVVVVPTRRRPSEQNPLPTTHRPSKGGV